MQKMGKVNKNLNDKKPKIKKKFNKVRKTQKLVNKLRNTQKKTILKIKQIIQI